ncbi:exopolyphosphatase PRUNE1 isoform X1 [Hyla sarda]|uniref:exopolyphosphatase PRUNE1 isoform X1 n=1 Tax=Hyla sarda TaxID=327740 RepID=UPI0024C3A5F2|nr:exopolyphosphatase PRUNE1 isoform X1 [Hyla sarda]
MQYVRKIFKGFASGPAKSRLSKATQTCLNKYEGIDFHVVLGNEACDLDSMVSAISLAYCLAKTSSSKNLAYVPVLNIPREDFPLRTESTFFLKENQIPEDLLVFRDEIDLGGLYEAGRLGLSLVDHNVLSRTDSFMEDVVTEVIDHRILERRLTRNCRVTAELVGSCATLVTEKIIREAPHILDSQLASMLRGTIVLDCVNMAPAAGKVTPKDTEYVTFIESKFPDLPPRGAVFNSLQDAKFDVSGLTTDQMLRKDLKALASRDIRLAISAIYMNIEEFLQRKDLETELQDFCQRHRYNVLIAMAIAFTSANEPMRQIAVYSHEGALRAMVSKVLEQATTPSLDLSPITRHHCHHVTAYSQGNVVASRKKVLPILKDFLKKRDSGESGSQLMQSFREAEDYNGRSEFAECNVEDNSEGSEQLGEFGEQPDNPDVCGGDRTKGKAYGMGFRRQMEDGLDEENSFPPTPMNSLVEGCPLDRGLPKLTAEAILERINRITVVDSEVNSSTEKQ